jgi:hypothetical protein
VVDLRRAPGLSVDLPNKPTNQQTNKPTNQQTNKPTNQQTNKQREAPHPF